MGILVHYELIIVEDVSQEYGSSLLVCLLLLAFKTVCNKKPKTKVRVSKRSIDNTWVFSLLSSQVLDLVNCRVE